MASFQEIANADFDLTHLWKLFISDDLKAEPSEAIYCSDVSYPTSPVSLEADMLNVMIAKLSDPEVSVTLYMPKDNINNKFTEQYFVDWNNNNYDEETG